MLWPSWLRSQCVIANLVQLLKWLLAIRRLTENRRLAEMAKRMIRSCSAVLLAFGAAHLPIAARAAENLDNWLRLEQNQQSEQLERAQQRYKAGQQDLSAPQQRQLEMRLQGQQARQRELHLRQHQGEMTRRQRLKALPPAPGVGPARQHGQRQRFQSEHNQLRLQQDIQRRGWFRPRR